MVGPEGQCVCSGGVGQGALSDKGRQAHLFGGTADEFSAVVHVLAASLLEGLGTRQSIINQNARPAMPMAKQT